MIKVRVQNADFDLAAEINAIKKQKQNIGAINSFVGCVRDVDNKLLQMTLEHYPKMSEKIITSIVHDAEKRWQLLATTVIHRVGKLKVNDNIVLVIVATKHRKESFLACQFIMDCLKTKAPFWKKETTNKGEKWLTQKQSDQDQTNLWLKNKSNKLAS